MSEILLPGTVTVAQATGPAFWPSSGVIGSGAIWTDGSDSTYAQAAMGYDGGVAQDDYGIATLPQATVDISTVTEIIVTVRADADPHIFGGGPENPLGLQVAIFGVGAFAFGPITGGAPIETYTILGTDMAALFGSPFNDYRDLVAGIFASAPTQIGAFVAGSYENDNPTVGRIYELSIELVAPGETQRRHVRMYPRVNGHFM